MADLLLKNSLARAGNQFSQQMGDRGLPPRVSLFSLIHGKTGRSATQINATGTFP